MQSGRPIVLALLAAGLAATPVQAATVRAPKAFARDCAAKPVRAQSVARTAYTPARDGLLTVRLNAPSGDWDLALFDVRTRAPVRAAAGFGARETVTAGVEGGRTYLAQACRRRGSATRARVSFRLTPARALPRARAQLLRVGLLSAADLPRLEAAGLDVTHNHGPGFVDVVSYGAADRAKLLAGGFTWRVKVGDLAAATRRALRPLRARAAQAEAGLPSGRTAYRTLADYEADLKKLAEAHPGLVRPLELGRSVEDRPIQGIEIATGVERVDDGRPVLAVLGLHHAREWPAGEMPMELAFELVKDTQRVRALLDRVRVVIVPVVNPDGFEVSRSAPTDAQLGEVLAYKRRNCRPEAGFEDLPCALRFGQGVDLNRNYGAYWGGVGASASVTGETYRGPAPYSEPESEAIHQLSQTRNIVTIISHHTFTDEGVWLRQPGFCLNKPAGGACSDEQDVVPDEAGMRALGDAMGQASGWQSLLGWKIGEITGATEDWNYFATGAYGFTPEQRSTNFHAAFADAVVAEWPGVREALLRAGEQAADPAHHAIVAGVARPGYRLRLKKAFQTPTLVEGTVVEDTIDLTLTVPESGQFAWHVNPSTRPLAPAPEAYAVTCEDPRTGVVQEKTVTVQRGATARLAMGCGLPDPALPEDAPPPAATPAPTPAPTAAPTATPAPFVAPAPAPAPALRRPPRLRLPKVGMSARIFNRRRLVRVPLRVDGGRVNRVVARLVGPGGIVFARARVARLDGDTRLTLRRLKRRRLERGRYTLIAQGRDARGRAVEARRTVRVRR